MDQQDYGGKFLITIDVEGDNLWSRSDTITTDNSRYLPRFHELCLKHRFRPTYLTNYEMAMCPVYQEFARDVIRSNTGEIGMHLHAWNSPPIVGLTANDYQYHPYLVEYDETTIRRKIQFITKLLEDTFQIDILSHRAGRWALNEYYAQQLFENGYKVDCSVTPYKSWARNPGDPNKEGGPDYTDFVTHPYFMNLANIIEPGNSGLLEVPMTVFHNGPRFIVKRINRLRNR